VALAEGALVIGKLHHGELRVPRALHRRVADRNDGVDGLHQRRWRWRQTRLELLPEFVEILAQGVLALPDGFHVAAQLFHVPGFLSRGRRRQTCEGQRRA